MYSRWSWRDLGFSFALHLMLVVLFLFFVRKESKLDNGITTSHLLIDIKTRAPISNQIKSLISNTKGPTKFRSSLRTNHSIDLRPSFIRDGSYLSLKKDLTGPGEINHSFAQEILHTEPKVLHLFDLLAEKINQHIEYPTILVENGVQGSATLDLYFDGDGYVDEDRSQFFGANRSVRGLLVKATRQGLLKWYFSDAHRLKKEQFKDQHFRADFALSYVVSGGPGMEKNAPGTYTFVRRNILSICAHPLGVDLACLAAKAAGTIQNNFSERYKIKWEALRDALEHYDNLGHKGIGNEIKGV